MTTTFDRSERARLSNISFLIIAYRFSVIQAKSKQDAWSAAEEELVYGVDQLPEDPEQRSDQGGGQRARRHQQRTLSRTQEFLRSVVAPTTSAIQVPETGLPHRVLRVGLCSVRQSQQQTRGGAKVRVLPS